MNKKAILLISAAMLLASCGGGQTPTSSAPASTPASEPTSQPSQEPSSEPSVEPSSESSEEPQIDPIDAFYEGLGGHNATLSTPIETGSTTLMQYKSIGQNGLAITTTAAAYSYGAVRNTQGIFYWYDVPSFGDFYLDSMISPDTETDFAEVLWEDTPDAYLPHTDYVLAIGDTIWEDDEEEQDGLHFTTANQAIGSFLLAPFGYGSYVAKYYTGTKLLLNEDGSEGQLTANLTAGTTSIDVTWTIGDFGNTHDAGLEAYLENPTPKAAQTGWTALQASVLSTYTGKYSLPFYEEFSAGLGVFDFSRGSGLVCIYDMTPAEGAYAGYAALLTAGGWTWYTGDDTYDLYTLVNPTDESRTMFAQLAMDSGALQILVYDAATPETASGLEAINDKVTALTVGEDGHMPAITDAGNLASDWALEDMTAMYNEWYGMDIMVAAYSITAKVESQADAYAVLDAYLAQLAAMEWTVYSGGPEDESMPTSVEGYDNICLEDPDGDYAVYFNYLNDESKWDGTITFTIMKYDWSAMGE